MQCPKCNEPLALTELRGIEVDRCSICRGVWFDQKELASLLQLSPAELGPIRGGKLEDDVNRQKAKCPRDHSDLTRVFSASNPDVIVDTCPKCLGIWLDGGELDRLLR